MSAPDHPEAAAMTVRRLLVDLQTPFPKRWHRNDFLTQYLNALSMSFPVGEQFFIDSVRGALPLLPDGAAHEALREEVTRFIGQEATHRHIHAQYNAQLEAQGLVNHWQRWATRRLQMAQEMGMHPKNLLAVTCAYEHLTGTLAQATLEHADWLDGAQARMQTLWRWHASEEIEHSAVAFSLYQAVGGSHGGRVRWYLHVLLTMALEATAQTLSNLRRSGTLWRLATWRDGLSFFFGRRGAAWRCGPALLRYFRRDFHPLREHAGTTGGMAMAQAWLEGNKSQWRAVR